MLSFCSDGSTKTFNFKNGYKTVKHLRAIALCVIFSWMDLTNPSHSGPWKFAMPLISA